jgi:hypothetical protein
MMAHQVALWHTSHASFKPLIISEGDVKAMENQTSPKAIITAAVTGSIHTPCMSHYLPLTSAQLIEDIMSVYEAGGAVAHARFWDNVPNHGFITLQGNNS